MKEQTEWHWHDKEINEIVKRPENESDRVGSWQQMLKTVIIIIIINTIIVMLCVNIYEITHCI